MLNKNESNSFINSCITFITFSIFFVTAALLINFFVPGAKTESEETANALVITDLTEENEEEFTLAFQDYFAEVKSATFDDSLDNGLKLYRQPLSRAAVEWFYFQITGDKNVSQAILTEAEANDIPISLAFALAYTESSYNAQAVNKNSNKTIDRGLFQLNNNSFPEKRVFFFFLK